MACLDQATLPQQISIGDSSSIWSHKFCRQVPGQTNTQKHSYVSVVGTRGTTLDVLPAYGEAPKVHKATIEKTISDHVRCLVHYIASDTCSRELHIELKRVLPMLKGISLDPMHICYALDRLMTKNGTKPKLAGLALRIIMGKCDIRHPALADTPLYAGGKLPKLSKSEEKWKHHISNGSLPMSRAKQILKSLDPNSAFLKLEDFMKAIAAFVVVYPGKLGTVDKEGTFRRSLIHIASPMQYHWLLNNVKCRSSLSPEMDMSKAAESLVAVIAHDFCAISNCALFMIVPLLRWTTHLEPMFQVLVTQACTRLGHVCLRNKICKALTQLARRE